MAPLTPAVVHVLLALAGGERHGYAILKNVQRAVGQPASLRPGHDLRHAAAVDGSGVGGGGGGAHRGN